MRKKTNNGEKQPPLSELGVLILLLCAKAKTVGARQALALAVRDGRFSDGRKLTQHWAALAAAREEYQKVLADVLAKLPPTT